MTGSRQRVFTFLVTHTREHGYAPSVREIMEGVGLKSPSTVQVHLANLERDGLIERAPNKARAITVLLR